MPDATGARRALGAAARVGPREAGRSASSTGTIASRRRASGRRAGRRRRRSSHERFPNRPTDFSLLYLGTTWLPRDLGPLLRIATPARRADRRQPGRRGVSGLGRRAASRSSTDRCDGAVSRPITSLYQSEFSQHSADEFLGEPDARPGRSCTTPSTSTHFTPAATPPAGGPVLLLGGDQTQAYRLELALRTLAALRAESPRRAAARHRPAREPDRAARRRARPRAAACTSLGGVRPARCAGVFRRAHLLLHTKVQGSVPDARRRGDGLRASGRPSGERRHGRARRRRRRDRRAPSRQWEQDVPPAPEELADAVDARARRPAALLGRGARARGRALLARAVARASRGALRAPRAEVAADAASQRRQLVARTPSPSSRASATSAPPTGRTSMRPTVRGRVAVLAQEVPDARAVAEPDRARRPRGRRAARRGSGRTRSARPLSNRADEVVDLLARMPTASPSRARAARRRHRPARRRVPAEEDRERDRAVPEVVARSAAPRPVFHDADGARRRVGGTTRETVERGVAQRTARRPAWSKSRRVDAVVVRERDDVRAHARRARRCARAKARVETAAGRLSSARPRATGVETLVLVLVDDDDPQSPDSACASSESRSATELVRPPDRRDDEVERRKLPRHGP